MITESMRKKPHRLGDKTLGTAMLLTISIATSIDAFAVGLSFAFLDISILVPVMVIGTVTFALSLFGVMIARSISVVVGNRVGIIGGVILIGIGIKILIDHMK
jgi:putative Mn2+ efflux pump MntP